MAISDNYSPDKNQGNGVTTEFSGSWKVLNSSYFRCALESVSTGVQTLLTLGSDYDLEFGESGYKATLHTAPSSAYYVVRYREVALDQTDPYRTSKGFQGTVIENSFDKLTAIEQDQNDQIERSIRCQVGDGSIGFIPAASARALKYLAFDGSGNPIASDGTTDTPISSAMTPVVSANTLADARTAMGLGSMAVEEASNYALISSVYGRNRIINGDMRIDQRYVGSSVTVNTDGLYVADRWRMGITQTGKFSVQRINNSSISTNNYALKFTSLSAFSPSASDQMGFGTILEGLDVEDLRQGSANAQPFTVSFKVKASVAGTYTLRATLVGSTNYMYTTTFNVAQANTEQTVSVTFPSCTSGTFNIDNTAGLVLWWDFGSGSTYTGAASAVWGTTQINKVTGSVSLLGTNAATFEITDIQIEKGQTATQFERIPVSLSLARCQRYYQKSYNQNISPYSAGYNYTGCITESDSYQSTGLIWTHVPCRYPVPMRASPTVVIYSPENGATGVVRDMQNAQNITATLQNAGENGFIVYSQATTSSTSWIRAFHHTSEAEM